MSNYVNLILGLATRIDTYSYKGKRNRYNEKKLSEQIVKYFTSIYRENDDKEFKKAFQVLIQDRRTIGIISINFFPNTYSKYAIYIPYYKFTNVFRFELRRLIYCLKFYADSISEFILAREKYDNCILLNKYEEALSIVDEVENKFGVSLWSGECKFFLFSRMEKDDRELINDESGSIIETIFDFYEVKNRENVTSDEYNYIVDKQISSLKQYGRTKSALIEFLAYAVNPLNYVGTDEGVMLLFEIIRRVSLIDQYIFFINLCEYVLDKEKEDEMYIDIKKYIEELKEIKDNNLIAIRFLFGDKDNRITNYVIKNKLDKVKEEFIKGNLQNVRNQAEELLRSDPSNVELINLYVDTVILLDDDIFCFESTNLGNLIIKLKSLYILEKNRSANLDDVKKFAFSTSFSSWSKFIWNSIIYRCQEYEYVESQKIRMFANLQYLDIETLIDGLTTSECIDFINQKLNLNNQYIEFRKAICEKQYNLARKLCQIEQIKDLLSVYDERINITDKLSYLGKVEGKDASIAILRIRYFISTIDLTENLEIALDISTRLVIDNIYASLFIPLEKILENVEKSDMDIRKNICVPILYYVYVYYYKKEKMDDFYITCEAFFMSNKILRPTKMTIDGNCKEKIIFFFRYVCNAKVLDMSVLDIINTQDRDQERLDICNILCQMDGENTKEYEKEIREITQRLMINKELRTIKENRIHVNIDGIKENLIKEYKNDFTRYKVFEDAAINKWNAYLENAEEVLQKTSERILKDLVIHIRNAFVSSDEYGLDVYLSLNIRHGTLADEMRGPFNKVMLNAKKDVESGKYIIDEHWICECNNNDKMIITNAISEFHNETEKIISKLKGKYIQIRTEEKETEGLFDYRLYPVQMLKISQAVVNIDTFEDFLDVIISFMWFLTECNLKNIKKVIKNEILEDYNIAINNLKTKVAILDNKNRMRELTQKINEASTDIQNVLDIICYWFQRSTESKANDFDIQFAFDLGLQTIKNMHPEKHFKAVAKEETVSDKIPGNYLKNYNGIFYNLFDNIYINAYAKDGKNIEIRYILKYQNGQTYIYLENDYDCTKDISKEKEKIEEQKEAIYSGMYKKRVKGEGGTGIPKICNIINSDLKRNCNINYDFLVQENKFFIIINF